MNFKWMNIFVVILYADQNFVTEGRCINGEVSPDQSDKTCKRYFLCSNGFLIAQQCLNNFVYSKITRTCVPTSSAYNYCNNYTTRRPMSTTRRPISTTHRPKSTTRRPMSTTYKIYPRCKEGETRPHPQDCRLYYVCSYHVWIPKVCPYNYVYSKTIGKCVLSNSPFDCSNTMYKWTTSTMSEIYSMTTTTPVEIGVLRAVEWDQCAFVSKFSGLFVQCCWPRVCEERYPTDFSFRGWNKRYRFSEQEQYPTTIYKYHPRCKEGETRPHYRDCKSYFICIYNVWNYRTCPKHMVYSKTVGKCVMSHSRYDYCSKTTYKMTTTTPVSTTTRYWTTTRKHTNCKDGETRPHRYDCRLYYVCSFNVWIPKECPYRNVYSKTVGKCVMSHSPYDHCSIYTTTSFITTTRKYPPKCKEGETRPHPQDCKSYYVCYNRAWVPKVCPYNYVYSKTTGKCVMSHSPFDYCANIPDFNGITSSTESCTSGETYPVRNNCFRYYYCSNGTLQQRTCVFDFVYSSRVKRCVPRYSKHADCKTYADPQ